jgi:hypothetical protein
MFHKYLVQDSQKGIEFHIHSRKKIQKQQKTEPNATRIQRMPMLVYNLPDLTSVPKIAHGACDAAFGRNSFSSNDSTCLFTLWCRCQIFISIFCDQDIVFDAYAANRIVFF